jgi:hypothetical protein
MGGPQHCFDPNTTYDNGSGTCLSCGHLNERGCVDSAIVCLDTANTQYNGSVRALRPAGREGLRRDALQHRPYGAQ